MDILYVHGVDPAGHLWEIVKCLTISWLLRSMVCGYLLNWPGLDGRQSTSNCWISRYQSLSAYNIITQRSDKRYRTWINPHGSSPWLGNISWSPLSWRFLRQIQTREGSWCGLEKANFDSSIDEGKKPTLLVDVMVKSRGTEGQHRHRIALAGGKTAAVWPARLGAKTLPQLNSNIASIEKFN